MALGGFLTATVASLTTDTGVINLTESIDASYVDSGTVRFLNGEIFEGILGSAAAAAADGGLSTITLRSIYNGTTITNQPMTAFNTIKGLRDAIRRVRNAVSDIEQFQSTFETLLVSTTPTIDITIDGVVTPMVPYRYLIDQIGDIATLTARVAALEAFHP